MYNWLKTVGIYSIVYSIVRQCLSRAVSYTWVPDVHSFLPCVSDNFLPLCHCKYSQRHRPLFKVADMCSRRGRSDLPSGDVLHRILLYTCWYLLSFPSLRAAPEICVRLFFGKFTKELTLCTFHYSCFDLACLLIWMYALLPSMAKEWWETLSNAKRSVVWKETVRETFWPFSPPSSWTHNRVNSWRWLRPAFFSHVAVGEGREVGRLIAEPYWHGQIIVALNPQQAIWYPSKRSPEGESFHFSQLVYK